jgi:pyruvate/2-oxoglutarate dehydrogenase complex dihydrolipoamide dehydrogenase (E3) component
MPARTVDVIVVGLGPGGEDAAGKLAQAGLDVVGIDAELVGGECPYWGCVPSKMMIRAANLLTEARRVDGMAGHAEVTADFAPVARRIRDEATDDWNDQVAVDRLESKGATFVRGWARLTGPGEVAVGDQVFAARRAVLLNPGTRAWAPPIEGLADTPYWTNREAIETETVPESLIVIGGGAIGLELGQVFLRFGAAVTVIETAPRLLAVEEPESSELITAELETEGMTVHVGANITGVRHDGRGFAVSVEGTDDVVAERLLVATGRRPDLAGLGVGAIGLDEGARAITVDEKMRAAEGVWAIGDVTGVGAFTHVSMYQAAIAVADILGRPGPGGDYRALPRVTFTDPEIGSVGLSEAAARAAGIAVAVGHSDVAKSTRGWIHKAGNAGMIKLVADTDRGVLVGATSAGPVGGEVLSMLTLAVHAEVPIATLRTMIYAYPTFHRSVEDALRSLAEQMPAGPGPGAQG